ncbi:MAG: urease accessory protein UreD [Ktedonobacteraceae bacterium]|nr:urease accessory protein UreD [Ktedonobacteraceae bacterium]
MSEQKPPLKVIRAFPILHGGALVHLHNISGGVLGGDSLALHVEVAPNAYAQLTSTSATRIYRCSPQASTSIQTSEVRVQEGGLLEYLPDPLIPFAGARYRQRTRIELAAGAGLFWWETVAPGRTARGELFDYDLVDISLAISTQDRPLALEHVKLEPKKRPVNPVARLGIYRYFSSFYICKVGIDPGRWLELEGQLSDLAHQLSTTGEVCWGVSTLVAHGLVVRALSCRGTELPAGLLAFWRAARLAIYGREALPPRKIY